VQRDKKAEHTLLDEAQSVEAKLGKLDTRLKKDFAKYVAIARIEPLTVEETQALLNPEEALVLLLPTGVEPPVPEETFIWVVTKPEARCVRSDLGAASLQDAVTALRCGLDYYGSWATKETKCPDLTQASYTAADAAVGKPLPFNLARAHALYKGLLGQVDDLI